MNHLGPHFTLGLVGGSFWNIANFLLLIGLSKAIVGVLQNKVKIASLVLVKFGVLYAVGYFMARVARFSLCAMSLGFSILFAVIFLRVSAKAFFRQGCSI